MLPRTRRHLALLALSRPLQRHARALQPDLNASGMLVHRALSVAFAEPAEAMRPEAGLEASLRADIDRRFRASHACA